MSFVALGGEGLRPTFFELVAAERLIPSLKAALVYSLSVAAQRRPALHHLLDREDELMFFVSLLLDRQALAATGGSFAEGLYGLRRAPVAPADAAQQASQASGGGGAAPATGAPPLTTAERQMSLVLLTLAPFLRAKLDSLYHRLLARQQAHQLQLQLPPGMPAQPGVGGSSASAAAAGSSGGPAWRQRARAAAVRAFLAVYPWAYAAHEGARFAYQLLYLLGRTPHYSPGLHLLGLQVVRLTGQEAVQQERAVQQRRAARLSRLQGDGRGGAAWLWGLLRRSWARAGYAVADHSRSALILAVFAFKLLEWWYSSAEAKLGDQKALPPPPPPPPLLPAPCGLELPLDVTLCPLCRRRRTNPAMLATSGYVFCYPCIHREVSERGRCPVTHVPARLDHVRRLYQGS